MKKNCFSKKKKYSRNVGNSIKCKKNIPPPPPNWDKKSEQGNRGYIEYRFPLSLDQLFGETTVSHLTSKWKREMKWEIIVFLKKDFRHSPIYLIFLNVGYI